MKPLAITLILFICFTSCKENSTSSTNSGGKVAVTAEQEEEAVKFPVYDYEGFESLLHKTDGKTYIVNFWATWCKPCIEELPDIEKIYYDYKDENVELILVSLDMPSMWKSKLEPFVEENQLKGKVVILDDPKMNDWIPKIDAEWDGGIPASMIYNSHKRQFYAQGFNYEELKNELIKFL